MVGARLILIGDDVAGLPPDERSFDLVWRLADLDWRADAPMPDGAISRDDIIQIIFTSGATAEPKGVVIRHRNVLANIVPVEREVMKYREYARPFHPLRFVNLLPLSHMFGQSMASSIPPMVRGTVIFTRSFNPHDVLRLIKTRRVSVLVCVPKILDVLREHVVHAFPEAAEAPPQGISIPGRWWRYRRVHAAFGLKFWAFVVGAAPLPPDVEEFWRRLGFVVIQGYGLTETAPIVTLNHPFKTSKGSVGTPIEGVEIRIADDGEILVRGENVTTGYYVAESRKPRAQSHAANAESVFDSEGWLHTGDIGERDAQGRLFIKGRKKEMIVTPDGLNVFPEDVERVLDEQPGVRESAVVGAVDGAQERVHAVLVVDAGAQVDAIIREANARLQDHQRIRTSSVWPGTELPRTEGTRKLKRRAIRDWVRAGGAPVAAQTGDSIESLISRFAHGRGVSGATTLDELGLSSLERVELMVALEDRFQTRIDEGRFSEVASVEDLKRLVEAPAAVDGVEEPVEFPSWNRTWPVKSDPPAVTGHVDRAADPRLRLCTRRRTRAPAWPRSAGRVRLEPPEPHGRPGDPVGAARSSPRACGAGHGQGVLQGPLLSRRAHLAAVVHELAQLLSGVVLLQRLSAASTRGRRPAHVEVHRRAVRNGLVHPDLSRRASGRRRDR